MPLDITNAHFGMAALKNITYSAIYPGLNVMNRTVYRAAFVDNTTDIPMDADLRYPDMGEKVNFDDWLMMSMHTLFRCGNRDMVPLPAEPVLAMPAPQAGNVTSNNGTAQTRTLSKSRSVPSSLSLSETESLEPDTNGTQQAPPLLGQLYPIGSLRLRMQRVRNDSCTVSGDVTPSDDSGDRNASLADAACYDKWVALGTEETEPLCNKPNPVDPHGARLYEHSDCSFFGGGTTTTTELAAYHCGGYIVDVPFTTPCERVLDLLSELTDPTCPFLAPAATRLAAMEYFAYSANLDVHFSVKHIVEVTAGGGFVPSDQFRAFLVYNGSRLGIAVFDFFFLAFIGYYVVRFVVDWRNFAKREGRAIRYLLDVWNLMELVNVVTYLVVFILRWIWWGKSVAYEDQALPAAAYPSELESLLLTYSQMRYAITFNFILTFLKVLKFLKISDRLAVVSRTFEKAQTDVFGLLVIFVLVIVGYGVAGNALFGPNMYEFSELDRAMSSLMMMLLGQLDYPSMKLVNPVLAGLYFWSFLVIAFFLVLNFIVAVIGDSFSAAGAESFIAPLDVAVLETLGNIWHALSCTVIGQKLALRREGITLDQLEAKALTYVKAGHALLRLKHPGALDILVTPKEVLRMLPTTERHQLLPFFERTWSQIHDAHKIMMSSEKEQLKAARRTTIAHGVRTGLRTAPGGAATDPRALDDTTAALEKVLKTGGELKEQLWELANDSPDSPLLSPRAGRALSPSGSVNFAGLSPKASGVRPGSPKHYGGRRASLGALRRASLGAAPPLPGSRPGSGMGGSRPGSSNAVARATSGAFECHGSHGVLRHGSSLGGFKVAQPAALATRARNDTEPHTQWEDVDAYE